MSEYIGVVESVSTSEPTWYRGLGSSNYELKPSLYRHPTQTDALDLLKIEFDLLKLFKQRSLPYVPFPHDGREVIDVMFLMQHYGAPTRLLDWTDNPYIALFFAVSASKIDPVSGDRDPVVIYTLKPDTWNNHALKFDPPPGILTPPDDLLNAYLPKTDPMTAGSTTAICIYGAHNSPRIVAQRGVFTLFGKSTVPMEEQYVSEGFPAESMEKIVVEGSQVAPIMNQLVQMGVTEAVIYPDLTGVALEIKRLKGFV